MPNRISGRLAALSINDKGTRKRIAAFLEDRTVNHFTHMVSALTRNDVITPSRIGEDGHPHPVFLKDKKGQLWLPVYTSLNVMPSGEHAPQSEAITRVQFLVTLDMVLKTDVSGVIINPFSENLIMKRELCEKILLVERQHAEPDYTDLLDEVPDQKAEAAKKEEQPENPEDEIVAKVVIAQPDGTARRVPMTEKQFDIYMRQKFDIGFLPQQFFADGENLINNLSENRVEALDHIYEDAYDREGQERLYPYVLDDFDVMPLDITDEITVVRIEMPHRNLVVPCALTVYLAWNHTTGSGRYFMIEPSVDQEARPFTEIKPADQSGMRFTRVALANHIEESAELQKIVDMMTGEDEPEQSRE